MPRLKNNMQVPDPAREAYSVIGNFDAIVDTASHPESYIEWVNSHRYPIEGDRGLFIYGASEAKGLTKELIQDFDGSTRNSLWLPGGIVKFNDREQSGPYSQKQVFLIGRRVSRGDPQDAIVLPAVFHVDPTNPVTAKSDAEDISSKARRLKQLDGWLKTVVESKAAELIIAEASA